MTFVRRSTGASSRLPEGKHGKMPVPREGRRRRSIGAVVFILAAAIVMLRPTSFAQGGDSVPPTITAQSPIAGATGVSTSITVTATFSEAIQPSTLVMEVLNSSSVVQASNVAYDPPTRTATLTLNAELAGSQTFTVRVSGARDLFNNQMALVTWTFTTATPGFQDVAMPQTGLFEPVNLQFASDGKIFVGERSGRIWFYDSLTDTTPTLFADLRKNVHNFWDRGLLGMVLHPQFPAVPYVYVLYTFDAVLPNFPAPRWGTNNSLTDNCADPTGVGCAVTGRLSRLNFNDFTGSALGTANEQVFITDWFQQFPSHSIGNLAFGADGALYATGGDGASFNYVDYGPPSAPAPVPASGDPNNEGGALRSQDLRTSGDPVGLGGTVIRINPDTGAALPNNPLFANSDANAKRIVAYGLRNPFRFTVKPGTNEIWIGDVGWTEWEEINWLADPLASPVKNFGWPCYEGVGIQSGYDSANRAICENLYTQSPALSGLTAPYYTYRHSNTVVPGEACPTGSSSITGLAFYPESGGSYPSSYNGALFFADHSRDCIWAMRVGANGLPDPSDIITIKSNPGGPTEGPVYLTSGPGGDIFYIALDDLNGTGGIRRITYSSGNQPPTAVAQANPSAGQSPLTVNFSAAGSTDPEGQTLTYTWDLDGDGAFDDATGIAPQRTYTSGSPLAVTVRVRATDTQGLSDVASVVVSVNNTAPVPFITTPTGSSQWKVGDVIAFSGGATDAEQGDLPATSLVWSLIMHHCPSNCHTHSITDYVGVAGGSFTTPDHEYPSFLELQLTATDAGGLQATTSVNLNPQTVDLTLQSNPSGLNVSINAFSGTTPFSRTVIAGSSNSISAPSPQAAGGAPYQFSSWSDGGLQTHTVVVPATSTAYTATFTPTTLPTGLVAAYNMDEGNGGTITDFTGHGLTGTIAGATWSTQGKYGGALSFDGVNDMVTVNDASAIDFTNAMTLEAWIFPTASGGGSWRNVLIKERTGGEVYNLYSNTDTNTPVIFAVPQSDGVPLDARGTSAVPLNAWTHLAVTYDNTTLRLFVNGVQVGTRAIAGPLLTSTGALRMGGNSIWGEFFQGRLDDVRLYNRALNQSEIQTDMASPVGGTVPDATPPTRSNAQPSGTLPVGTTQTTLSLTTDESATCKYSTTAGTAYASMPSTFTTTGATSHSTIVTGLANGGNYTYYVRCQDGTGNANTNDLTIAFSVAQTDVVPPVRSNGLPTGTLAAGTTQATLSLTTNEAAACRYGTVPGTAYASLSNFTTTGGTSHSTVVTGLTNGGSYSYYIRCQDGSGNANTDDFTIAFTVATPDNTLPQASMTAPANGATVSGLVTVSANATDNVAVVGVQFLLNGASVGAEDTSAPYSISWNSASVVNGNYQLSARARDAAGNTATATAVNVVVANSNTGLIAAYNFDEGSGTSLTDLAGLGHTGTIAGAAAWSAAGKNGGALVFDGVNDMVTVNDANDLDFTTALTLEAWIFPTVSGGGAFRNVLIKERTAGEIYNLYSNTDTNVPVVYAVPASTGVPLDARGTSAAPLNAWTHLAVTYDNTTLRLFVNGVQVGTRALAGPLLTSTGALRMGGNSIWGEFFQGRLDDVRLYNRALTQPEIQADMDTPVGGTGPDATPPTRSNAQPSGTLPVGTTQTTLSLTTNEAATCKYGTAAGTAYASMPSTFTTTGATSHSTVVTGLVNGGSYTYYVRCQDVIGNANTNDLTIAFSVAQPDVVPPVRSNGLPTGTLAAGTTQATLSLTTNEAATCRYGTVAGTDYASLSNFTTTGGTSHSTVVTGLANGGSYSYYIRCQDGSANANTDDFTIAFAVATPDNTLPQASMTAPANGATVSGLVTVSANASDNVGVVGVQFLLNGASIGAEDTSAPYSISWNSASVVNGNYQLSARARDAAGNTATATAVNVVVANSNTGLIAAYNFNEGAGTTVTDRAGLGHTGTIAGAAAWSAAGKNGGALSFDGVNDWVTVNDANDLDFTTAMTLEAWIFPTASGGGSFRNVLIKERSAGEVYNLYSNSDTNVPTVFVVRNAQSGQPLDVRGTSAVPLNTWTHLAVTYDNTTLRLFVNGVQVGTRAVAGPLLTSTGALRIGGNSKWGEFFQGQIDDIRIYNRALTAVELQSDMTSPVQ